MTTLQQVKIENMIVSDVENVENQPPAKEKPQGGSEKETVITLEILKLVKDAQQQHGLRHGDYQRYRGYCSRRIRRLRKVLHLTQGDRRHYKRKDVTATALVDNRSLLIPLMQAERAWGYAMQLRQESNTEPRKKYHLVARLRKAATHALALEELCQTAACDPRTRLEAQAYVAWMNGCLQFELQLWKPAMDDLKKAQVVYEKLAEAVPEGDQQIYKNRVEELNPSIRYCAYNIGDSGALEDVLALRTHSDLIANFDALLQKSKKDAADSEELSWRGYSLPLRPERVRLFALADKQLDSALEHAATLADRLKLLEDNLMDCKDAIASLRDDLQVDASWKNMRERGQLLLTFLTYCRLSRTVKRNLLMAEQMRGVEGKKPRPQDLARIYEMVLQNLTEMAALPGLEADEAHQKETKEKVALHKAFRCFYIAEYLASLQRWKEAVALYDRATSHISAAPPKALASEWTKLRADIDRSKFSAHAQSVLEGEAVEETTATKQFRSRKPLSERLDDYREEPSLLTRTPNVVRLPPDMRPVPCKPLFFDLALNLAELPNLDHKVDAAGRRQNPSGITGLVKGFLGWGSSK